MKIVIVGAGIMGAVLAYQLTRRGADVTVLEAGQPGGGASAATFGWINASFFADDDHFHLRQEGIAAHHRLTKVLRSSATRWPGTLWWQEVGEAFDAQHAALQRLGYSLREIGPAEFARMEPAVRPPSAALFFPEEGVVDLDVLGRDALSGALEAGARLVFGVRAEAIEQRGGRVTGVRTAQGVVPADRVCVANGTGAETLLASVSEHLPMLSRPGLILRSAPVTAQLNHVLAMPEQELRQLPDGRLLAPTAAAHQQDVAEHIIEMPVSLADAAAERISGLLNCPVRWEAVGLAARPVPHDGLPVIGGCALEGLYATVMHSGATLAAIVGELAAAELTDTPLSNTEAALLAPYRPSRFVRSNS